MLHSNTSCLYSLLIQLTMLLLTAEREPSNFEKIGLILEHMRQQARNTALPEELRGMLPQLAMQISQQAIRYV